MTDHETLLQIKSLLDSHFAAITPTSEPPPPQPVAPHITDARDLLGNGPVGPVTEPEAPHGGGAGGYPSGHEFTGNGNPLTNPLQAGVPFDITIIYDGRNEGRFEASLYPATGAPTFPAGTYATLAVLDSNGNQVGIDQPGILPAFTQLTGQPAGKYTARLIVPVDGPFTSQWD